MQYIRNMYYYNYYNRAASIEAHLLCLDTTCISLIYCYVFVTQLVVVISGLTLYINML